MTSATFRFYARLNHFLPSERRSQPFTVVCAENATIKHMVEALGVPHTEIALVLANGEAAALDQQVTDGARIAVYPEFASLDISTVTRVRQPAGGVPIFVADAHLGALARLLRMAGFDTLYDNGIDDAEIAKVAYQQGRVLLTRDRDLLKHRAVTHGCYVHSVKPHDQLRELFDRLGLDTHIRPLSRCLNCNVVLQQIARARVLERIPQGVRERHERFWLCEACDQVYWEGTHWQKMRQMLETLTMPRSDNPNRSR
ncbi:Mut7-C RNAse domain-containing protein [Halopseudomonas sp.]|uniref:Mut7-C RNAse domain-containing protein n=1 Tax=Halopseudomonas sp. TaxID=2901191 RepID=UPI003565E4F9